MIMTLAKINKTLSEAGLAPSWIALDVLSKGYSR